MYFGDFIKSSVQRAPRRTDAFSHKSFCFALLQITSRHAVTLKYTRRFCFHLHRVKYRVISIRFRGIPTGHLRYPTAQFVKSKISASQIRGRVRYLPLGIYRYGNATWKPLGARLPARVPDFRIKWRILSCGHAVNLWSLRRGDPARSTFELTGQISIAVTSLIEVRR